MQYSRIKAQVDAAVLFMQQHKTQGFEAYVIPLHSELEYRALFKTVF